MQQYVWYKTARKKKKSHLKGTKVCDEGAVFTQGQWKNKVCNCQQ